MIYIDIKYHIIMTTPLLKRINGEIKQIRKNKSSEFQIIPDETNMQIFYFLLKPAHKPYANGLYIGKIVLPDNFPHTAPNYYMLTPSGRFNINAPICLSNSGYHNTTWNPHWTIVNITKGFLSILLSENQSDFGLNHIHNSVEIREKLASDSIEYNIKNYPSIFKKFDYFVNEDFTIKSDDEINKIINS